MVALASLDSHTFGAMPD